MAQTKTTDWKKEFKEKWLNSEFHTENKFGGIVANPLLIEAFISQVESEAFERGKRGEQGKVINEEVRMEIHEDGSRFFNGMPDYEYLKIQALKRIADGIESLSQKPEEK